MTLYRALLALPRWAWWAWIKSPASGGGPTHPSYAHARWQAWVARQTVMLYLMGRDAG